MAKARDKTSYEGMSDLFKTRNVDDNAAHLKQYIKPDSKILDVGCGPGSITIGLAQLCPEGQVIGVDINQESLDIATGLARDSGLKNLSFQHADATSDTFLANFPDNHFDIIHGHQVLMHLPDPISTLTHLRRVCKPGGHIGSRDLTNFFFNPATPHMLGQKSDIETHLIPHSGGGRKNHIWMREAGFEWEKIRTGSAAWEWSGPELRKLAVQGMQKGARELSISKGFRDEAFWDVLARDWEEWVEKPEARFIGLDGWVVAEK